MKKKWIALLGAMVLLSGCTGEDDRLEYEGKTNNWYITYVAYVQDGNRMSTDGTLHFIGDGEVPKAIDYALNTAENTATGKDIAIQGKIATFNQSSCSGCSVIKGTEAVDVTIEWNGQKETIALKKDN